MNLPSSYLDAIVGVSLVGLGMIFQNIIRSILKHPSQITYQKIGEPGIKVTYSLRKDGMFTNSDTYHQLYVQTDNPEQLINNIITGGIYLFGFRFVQIKTNEVIKLISVTKHDPDKYSFKAGFLIRVAQYIGFGNFTDSCTDGEIEYMIDEYIESTPSKLEDVRHDG